MVYSLHYLLMANHIMVQKKLFADINHLGLTLGQPKILDYLKDFDGAIQKDIANACHIEPASLSTILNGMEKKGLIKRTAGDNKRSTKICLTEKGKAMSNEIDIAFDKIEKEVLADFSKEEIEKLNQYLERIQHNLGGKNA